MGHLNELNEEYAAKGLTILAVSNEASSAIEGFIEELSPAYPIMIDAGDGMADYGASGYPSSFLIGPDGNILWAGHPAGMTPELVEEHIGDVQLFPDIPKSLKGIEKEMNKGKYGKALKKLEALITKGSLPDEDKDVAEQMRAMMDGMGSHGLEKAAKNLREGHVYKAFTAYEKLERKFKGHAYSAKAKTACKELEANKDYKLEIKAAEKWAKIKPQLKGLAAKKALALLKPLAGRKYEETKAGKKAAEEVRKLEHAIR